MLSSLHISIRFCLFAVSGKPSGERVALPIRTISPTKSPFIFSRRIAEMFTQFAKVATTLEVPPGVMKMVQVAGQEVCLANVDGKCYAIGNVCTHEEGPLDQGRLEEYEVECPWHGSLFDIRTGQVKMGPASKPEPVYEVKVEGTNILVRPK